MKILTKKMLAGKNFQRFSYPKDIDKEMIDFMDVLNSIPGCRTLFCCQGHGRGAWYFVANCCNMFPYKAIRSYFQEKQKHNSKIEILEGCDSSLDDLFRELQIAVYDESFDKMTLTKKKSAYKKMCEYFLEYVPRKHW